MVRAIHRLTATDVGALDEPGLHADGAGLYLRIDQTLARRWVFIFNRHGRRREMGLGSASTVDLQRARSLAADARAEVAAGRDPIATRRLQADGARAAAAMARRAMTAWASETPHATTVASEA